MFYIVFFFFKIPTFSHLFFSKTSLNMDLPLAPAWSYIQVILVLTASERVHISCGWCYSWLSSLLSECYSIFGWGWNYIEKYLFCKTCPEGRCQSISDLNLLKATQANPLHSSSWSIYRTIWSKCQSQSNNEHCAKGKWFKCSCWRWWWSFTRADGKSQHL